jgi:hypothetical protein
MVVHLPRSDSKGRKRSVPGNFGAFLQETVVSGGRNHRPGYWSFLPQLKFRFETTLNESKYITFTILYVFTKNLTTTKLYGGVRAPGAPPDPNGSLILMTKDIKE